MAGRTDHRRLRVTRLSMQAWRNFNRKAELKLGARTFLIGPNASGKSNILDALRFLRDVAESGFGKAVETRGGMGEVRSLHATNFRGIEISVDVGSQETPDKWSYTLRFQNHPKKHVPVVVHETVHVDGKCVLERPDKRDKQDQERLTQTHLEQVSENQAFRELAGFFKSIRYLHIVPQIVRNPRHNGAGANDPFGSDFLERVATTNQRTKASRLEKIQKALQVAVPQLSKFELERDPRGDWHLYANYEHWRPRAARQSEIALSDGTIRMLGLFWALAEGGGPLLLEEPELGLHDSLVSRLPGIMAKMHRTQGSQVLVTTHSAALLQDRGIALEEIYLLVPESEGTKVRNTASMDYVRALVEAGHYPGEAVMPCAAPDDPAQISFSF